MDMTVIETFKAFLTDVWAPQLEQVGFYGKGFDYSRNRGPYTDVIKVDPDVDGAAVRVYLGVFSRQVLTSGDYGDEGQAVVGSLMASRYLTLAGGVDGFWTNNPESPMNLKIVLDNLHALFMEEGMTFFDEASTPRAPGAHRPRPWAIIR